MTYDAMRVLLRVALMKRALFDIHIETSRAQQATRKNLQSNIHFSQIMADTAHAYDVVARLYTKLEEWRAQHTPQLQMPASDTALDMATIAAFISRISTQVDIETLAHGAFPGVGKAGDCTWVGPHPGMHSDISQLDAPLESDDGASAADDDDDLPVGNDDDDYDDDDDYPYRTHSTELSETDAYDVFLGWTMSSHQQQGNHPRDDFACGDLAPSWSDASHTELTSQEYQLLFGLIPPATPRYKINIFGEPIIPPPADDDDDSPDYNVPGAPLG